MVPSISLKPLGIKHGLLGVFVMPTMNNERYIIYFIFNNINRKHVVSNILTSIFVASRRLL